MGPNAEIHVFVAFNEMEAPRRPEKEIEHYVGKKDFSRTSGLERRFRWQEPDL